MKKTLVKSIKISFQEKTSKGFVDRSFDTPKETVGTATDWVALRRLLELINEEVDS
mgnify:CR=1 FL=1